MKGHHTTTEDEWGPWKRHNGKFCPLPEGTRVRVIFEYNPGQFSDPIEGTTGNPGLSWDWSWWRQPDPWHENAIVARIVRYQVLRPKSREAERLIQSVKDMTTTADTEKEKA